VGDVTGRDWDLLLSPYREKRKERFTEILENLMVKANHVARGKKRAKKSMVATQLPQIKPTSLGGKKKQGSQTRTSKYLRNQTVRPRIGGRKIVNESASSVLQTLEINRKAEGGKRKLKEIWEKGQDPTRKSAKSRERRRGSC